MSENTDFASPEMESAVQELRDNHLAGRATLGAAVYPIAFFMIAYATGWTIRQPKLTIALLLLLSLLALARLAICLPFHKLYSKSPQLWRACFMLSVATLGSSWGLITAYSMIISPWSPTTMLFLFAGAGLAGGMIATIAIDKNVYRCYLIGILVPPGITSIIVDQHHGFVLGGCQLLYFIFLWLQGKRQSNWFQQWARGTVEVLAQRDELFEAKKKAEKASIAKSYMLANVSHELRTPLNAIIGTAEWARTHPEREPSAPLWEEVHNAGLHLLNIVNHVLDLAKIESGTLSEPQNRSFRPSETLMQVENLFVRTARDKDIVLEFESLMDNSLSLMADEGRVRQILCNLIGNALKFTNQGTVSVRAEHKNGLLSISVRDTGVGIPSEHLESIFEPFNQADGSAARLHCGAGLGLSISKELTHSMGGSLTVDSKLGEGSHFYFSIPAPICQAALEATPPLTNFSRDYTVLVVDDDRTNQRVATRQITALGMSVDIAGSGSDALAKCELRKYDFILMDLQMPTVDGFAITAQLKSARQSRNLSTPVIAFTAHTGPQEQAKCENVGMVGFLNKPLQRIVLVEEILRLEEHGLLSGRTVEDRE